MHLVDAGWVVAGDEDVAVPLVVVAVRVLVRQVNGVTKGGVAIYMVAGGPGLDLDALAAVADDLVVVQVVVVGVDDESQPSSVHGKDVVVDMRVSGVGEEERVKLVID